MAPAAKLPAPTTEIGFAGPYLTNWWTAPDLDETPELRWPLSVRVFDQMRRQDAQVKSVLRAVTLPVRRTPWRIDPAGARDEVVEFIASELGLPIVGQPEDEQTPGRSRDRFSWSAHLRHVLLALPYGHMFFEQVARIGDDGRAHLRKLAPRMPRTITAVNVARDGGLVSIEQWGADDPIPVERLVAYVPDREAGNWLGESLLRSAYKNWLVKDRLLRVQAQTVERNGMGIPVYQGAENEVSLEAGQAIAQAWRSGQGAGAAIPFGAQLGLVGVSGALPDADKPIRYHDEQIGRSVLAHFLNLGSQTGSWALGTTFADFFTMSLQTVAEDVADVTNGHVIEDLVDWNFGTDENAPRLVFDEIGSRAQVTAASIQQLIGAGALKPDPSLEAYLRQVFGLPTPVEVDESAAAPVDPATGEPIPVDPAAVDPTAPA